MPKKSTFYTEPAMEGGQYEVSVSKTALGKMGKDRQQEIMKHWFYQCFENPVNGMPYDSEEGGYIYINGGPFDAREILEEEFLPTVKQKAIDELVEELQQDSWEWTRTDCYDAELYPRDDFYEIDAALDNQTPIENLETSLESMRQLLDVKDSSPTELHKFQLMMIYGFCITSMEAYLSDIFAKYVMNDNALRIKYLQIERAFSEQKFNLSQIFEKYAKIDLLIKKEIADTAFHNLGRIKSLFKGVLDVDFGDIEELSKLINKRHDFVHRGGKDVHGNEVKTTKDEVFGLIETVKNFCCGIDEKLNPFF